MGVHGVSLILCQSHSSEAADLDRSGTGVYIKCSTVEQTFTSGSLFSIQKTRRFDQALLVEESPSHLQGPMPVIYKKGVIYRVPCQDCPKVYIGETGRKLDTRLTEHKRHCRLMQPEKS